MGDVTAAHIEQANAIVEHTAKGGVARLIAGGIEIKMTKARLDGTKQIVSGTDDAGGGVAVFLSHVAAVWLEPKATPYDPSWGS